VTLLNELDGFSVYPQLRVCFSGPVNPSTIPDGLFIVPLRALSSWIRTTRIVYDSAANCAFAKPERVLESGENYGLIVTTGIRDATGRPVKADPRFTKSLVTGLIPAHLADSASLLAQLTDRVAAASVFTTLSATDWIKDARNFVSTDGTAGTLASLNIAEMKEVSSLTWLTQTKVSGVTPNDLTPFKIPLERLEGVTRLAVGTVLSPNFLSFPTLTIPTVETRTGSLKTQMYPLAIPNVPVGYAPISFHVFLPSGKPPKDGYPVAIYGHGMGDDQWRGATTYIASTLAKNGIALIGVEVFGHGFGPASLLGITSTSGATVLAPSPGRTVPVDGANFNPEISGCIVLPGPVATRDCFRQTTVDMFALVKMITGSNNFSKQLNLDASRISYIGQSFGAVLGTMVAATEPRITSAVLNGVGGPVVDIARMQNPPALAYAYLQTRTPPMPYMDVLAFQGQEPKPTTDSAALKAFEVTEWFNMPGDPLAFAAGLVNKPVLFQIARGDEEVPNPTNSMLIRAARGQSRTWLYRADRAAAIVTTIPLPSQPHRYLSEPFMYDSMARTSIAKAAQQQVADFISSDGKISDPNHALTAPFTFRDKLFEIPEKLPDTLNYPYYEAP
jgi:pimeloyl-ACP methyl ester carboxylesterase